MRINELIFRVVQIKFNVEMCQLLKVDFKNYFISPPIQMRDQLI